MGVLMLFDTVFAMKTKKGWKKKMFCLHLRNLFFLKCCRQAGCCLLLSLNPHAVVA